MYRLAVPAALLAVTLAACGAGVPGADPTGTKTPAPTVTVDPTPDPTGPGSPPFTANTDPDRGEAAGMPSTVTDVTLEQLDGFDRLTLTFSGEGRPSWLVQYEDQPTRDGSGAAVNLSGDAVLVVGMNNTAYPGDTSAPDGYTGEKQFTGPGVIEEVLFGGVYEGRTEIFLGIGVEQPFRVTWDDATNSVVIEVIAPS